VNAKVVLIGEGAVGKTSLAHRLIDDKYVIRDRTHGMNVWRLDLPLGAPSSGRHLNGDKKSRLEGGAPSGAPSEDDTLDREALLWDLAGQEDYRLIHRLFLNETALALLLINPQKDDPFAEAGDWLKSLETDQNQESRGIRRAVDVGGKDPSPGRTPIPPYKIRKLRWNVALGWESMISDDCNRNLSPQPKKNGHKKHKNSQK